MNTSPLYTRALYLQVRDALVKKITDGEWRPGKALANEYQLAQDVGVSVGTMRKALGLMERELLIVRQQGRGTFVSDQSTAEMSQRFSSVRDEAGDRIVGFIKPLSVEAGPATDIEIAKLRLAASVNIIRIVRLLLQDEMPYMIENCTLPEALFPVMPEDAGSYRIYASAQANNIRLGRSTEKVSAGAADDNEAALLNVASGTPVLKLDRMIYSLDGQPIEWRKATCYLRGDHFYASTG